MRRYPFFHAFLKSRVGPLHSKGRSSGTNSGPRILWRA